jgi:hypothetical protein
LRKNLRKNAASEIKFLTKSWVIKVLLLQSNEQEIFFLAVNACFIDEIKQKGKTFYFELKSKIYYRHPL